MPARGYSSRGMVMKFYKHPDGKWEAIANSNSRYWEIHKGYDKLPSEEITVVKFFGFGWNPHGIKQDGFLKQRLTNQQFRGWLIDRREEYEHMLKKINALIVRLCKESLDEYNLSKSKGKL